MSAPLLCSDTTNPVSYLGGVPLRIPCITSRAHRNSLSHQSATPLPVAFQTRVREAATTSQSAGTTILFGRGAYDHGAGRRRVRAVLAGAQMVRPADAPGAPARCVAMASGRHHAIKMLPTGARRKVNGEPAAPGRQGATRYTRCWRMSKVFYRVLGSCHPARLRLPGSRHRSHSGRLLVVCWVFRERNPQCSSVLTYSSPFSSKPDVAS